jgi:hypothetical protein
MMTAIPAAPPMTPTIFRARLPPSRIRSPSVSVALAGSGTAQDRTVAPVGTPSTTPVSRSSAAIVMTSVLAISSGRCRSTSTGALTSTLPAEQ